MISYGRHQFPGKLFVVEGTDGSGKSTQLALLHQWLKAEGYPVFFSEWNSSPLVKDTTRRAKKKHLFTPASFSLLHATDFADRTERNIIPPLKAGAIVLADRYIYTAFARDVARGCDRAWVREVYKFAVKPTAAFFFRAPLDVAIDRIASGRPQLKFYEAGMDMGWPDGYRWHAGDSGATAADARNRQPLSEREAEREGANLNERTEVLWHRSAE